MSIKVMTYVWDHSKQQGSALLMLLTIADHAHDDGTGAYPSIKRLAERTRMTERNAQYLIQKLIAAGELICDVAAGPNGVNLFAIPLTEGVKPTSPPIKEGVKGVSGGGEIQRKKGVKPIAPKPLLEPSVEPLGEGATPSPPASPVRKRTSKTTANPLSQSPEIQMFRAITGHYPPQEHYEAVISALRGRSEENVKPYWLKWLTISGNRYSLVWLLEWLASGQPADEFGANRKGGLNGGDKTNSRIDLNSSTRAPFDPSHPRHKAVI